MDDQLVANARQYCTHQLASRGFPPTVDLDDLIQDYCVGELEGTGGPSAVLRSLGKSSAEEGKRITIKADGHAAPDREPGVTDEELDMFRQIEEEIVAELNKNKAGPLFRALAEEIPFERASVFRRYHGIGCNPEDAAEIADTLGWQHHQVNDVVEEVARVLRARFVGVKVDAPLIGEPIQVTKNRKRGWRKVKKQKRVEGKLLGVA